MNGTFHFKLSVASAMPVRPPQEARRTERGEQRRRKLLAAARQVFLERGYVGASIEEVMRRVGGSKASLYRYFGSKEGLFFDILAVESERFMKDLEIPQSADQDVEATLTAIGRRFLRQMIDEDRLGLYRVIFAEAQRFPELARRFFERGPRRSHAALAHYLRLQTQAGRLDCPDPDFAAAQFFELIKGRPHSALLFGLAPFPRGAGREAHIAASVRLFLYGCSRSRR
jgi:AcrR family transcriptional regulator